ncbi:hypothetical protein ACOMHN_017991 [Nucella lapillus]
METFTHVTWHLGFLLIMLLSQDIEVNPGPRAVKYPCGECYKAVKQKDKGVACDNCETWYHTQCMKMSDTIYYSITSNTSWVCYQCGMPNFSSTLFTSVPAESVHGSRNDVTREQPTHPSLDDAMNEHATGPLPNDRVSTENAEKSAHPSLDDILRESSLSHIDATLSSPSFFTSGSLSLLIPRPDATPPRASTPENSDKTLSFTFSESELDPNDTQPQTPLRNSANLRCLTINFQSIRPKKAEFLHTLEYWAPDIIMGTETWLKPEIHSAEIFPPSYTVYRCDGNRGYGGTLLAVKSNLISYEIPIKSAADAVLVHIQTQKKSEPLILGSIYRTPSATSTQQMAEILRTLDTAKNNAKSNGVIWIGGDLNLPDIEWETQQVVGHQNPMRVNRDFLDKINDMGLVQTNDKPTRGENILDIFCSNRPDLVTRSTTLPGLSDHDILLTDSRLKAAKKKPVARKIHLWKKADFTSIRAKTAVFTANLLKEEELTVEEHWTKITNHLTDMMETAQLNKGQTDLILLDFSKAFDKVPHLRLLSKLELYGVRGKTKQWIESFLHERTQQVVVEGESSTVGQVISGVPQGSVLGPTLFLLYINDLGEGIRSKIRLFADDTILYSTIKGITDAANLQRDLEKLESWETKWQMAFNADKCHVLTVSNKLPKNLITGNYSLHGQTLEKVRKAKYLGVEIAHDLDWKSHVVATAAKANRTSAFTYRNLKGCATGVQTHCYKALARPLLEYASPVWSPHTAEQIAALEAVQRRAARRILGDYRRTTSASGLVKQLGLDTLQSRRQTDRACLMFKVVRNYVDISIPVELIQKSKDGMQTRGHREKMMQTQPSVDTYKYSFFPASIILWNALPTPFLTAQLVPSFRSSLRGWAPPSL